MPSKNLASWWLVEPPISKICVSEKMDEHFPIFGDEPSTTTPAFLDRWTTPTLEIRSEFWEHTLGMFWTQALGKSSNFNWWSNGWSIHQRRMTWDTQIPTSSDDCHRCHSTLHPHSPPCLCLSCLFTSTETTIEADHVWKDPPSFSATLGQLGLKIPISPLFLTHMIRGVDSIPNQSSKTNLKKIRFAGGLYFPKS